MWYRCKKEPALAAFFMREGDRFHRFDTYSEGWEFATHQIWVDEPSDTISCLLEIVLITGTTGPDK